MSAAEALNAARAAGVLIFVEGNDLVLQASVPPPAAVLDTLCRHKMDIVTLLLSEKDERTEEYIPWADWRASELNRLFRKRGVTGESGCITAATVRHGEQFRSK